MSNNDDILAMLNEGLIETDDKQKLNPADIPDAKKDGAKGNPDAVRKDATKSGGLGVPKIPFKDAPPLQPRIPTPPKKVAKKKMPDPKEEVKAKREARKVEDAKRKDDARAKLGGEGKDSKDEAKARGLAKAREAKREAEAKAKRKAKRDAEGKDDDNTRQRLMTANVHCKLWEAKRTDSNVSKKVMKEAKAGDNSGKFVKNLIDRDKYVKPLEQVRTRAKALLYKWTCAWTYGTRVLTVEAYVPFKAELSAVIAEYYNDVAKFIRDDYDTAKEEAKGILGSMWNEADYPTAAQLEEKYAMRLDVTPFPDGVNLDLPDDVREEIRKDVEHNFNERTEAAMLELVDRITKGLSDFSERVRKEPKDWKDSAVQNLKDILEIADKLNVSGSKVVSEMIELANVRMAALLRMDTGSVRKLPQSDRLDLAAEALQTAKQIKEMLEG